MCHLKKCGFYIAVLAAAAVFAGCSDTKDEKSGVNNINIASLIASSPTTEPETDVSTVDSGSGAASGEPIFSEIETSNAESGSYEWTENAHISELYVCYGSYGREEPFPDAAPTRLYEVNEAVRTVAVTSTGYYKLENGDYIYGDSVSTEKTFIPETVKIKVSDTPPKNTSGACKYDPKKALDYAKEHWRDDESLCAGFGSECLTAGGLDYAITSSTQLFNRLTEANLGYSVGIDLNEDGTASLPDYVYPGDMIFYYCKDENMMVHTAIYNGDNKDGLMKAYAHNLADNGERAFRYFERCVEGCGCVLDKIVVFCFYRDTDTVKQPSRPAEMSHELTERGVKLSWTADYLYRDSELVIVNESGKEVYRRSMGTDKQFSVKIQSPGKYTAHVETRISGDVTVSSKNEVFEIKR